MEPKAFLELAQQLSEKIECEASLRSCVSRSYYALFNLTAQFIDRNIEKLPKDASAHKKVYYYLFESKIEEMVDLAGSLQDLRNDRNASDYNLEEDKFQNPNMVVLFYRKGQMAFNSFETFIQNRHRRKRLIKSIQQYKQETNS